MAKQRESGILWRWERHKELRRVQDMSSEVTQVGWEGVGAGGPEGGEFGAKCEHTEALEVTRAVTEKLDRVHGLAWSTGWKWL